MTPPISGGRRAPCQLAIDQIRLDQIRFRAEDAKSSVRLDILPSRLPLLLSRYLIHTRPRPRTPTPCSTGPTAAEPRRLLIDLDLNSSPN